jgi:type I restriction enzyme M protein
VYLVVEDGWKARVKRIVEKNKKGKEIDKGWTCDLLPKTLVTDAYLSTEKEELQELQNQLESTSNSIVSLQEEYAVEGGLLEDATNDKGVFTKAIITAFIKKNKTASTEKEAVAKANEVLQAYTKEAKLKKEIKTAETNLDALLLKKYAELTDDEVQDLVVNLKWLTYLQNALQTEVESISQSLTTTIKTLAERYSSTLTELDTTVTGLESEVNTHLQKMGLL